MSVPPLSHNGSHAMPLFAATLHDISTLALETSEHFGRLPDRTSSPALASRKAIFGFTFPLYPAKRAPVVPLALAHSGRRKVRRIPGPCYPAEMGRQFPGPLAPCPPARRMSQGILVLANR